MLDTRQVLRQRGPLRLLHGSGGWFSGYKVKFGFNGCDICADRVFQQAALHTRELLALFAELVAAQMGNLVSELRDLGVFEADVVAMGSEHLFPAHQDLGSLFQLLLVVQQLLTRFSRRLLLLAQRGHEATDLLAQGMRVQIAEVLGRSNHIRQCAMARPGSAIGGCPDCVTRRR